MARPRKKQTGLDLNSLLLTAAEQLNQVVRAPNINSYEPHRKQVLFHKSTSPSRLYIGGNRSGKTFGAVAEDIWWASGTHPYRKTPPPPVRGRVIGVDLMQGVNQILIPVFKQLIAPSMLINGSWEDSYNKQERVLTFDNGSTIEFMSYEMDTEKFAGTSRHFVHYDEEPPQHVYNESQMRLIDTDGESWISMTPVEGITWVFDQLYKPTAEAEDKQLIVAPHKGIGQVIKSDSLGTTIVEVDISENPHLSRAAIERITQGLDEDEKKARMSGKFVQMGGLIFKNFSEETHVIPSSEFITPPRGWEIYTSVDHGWNNPTAWLWHAVSPNGDIVTFAEHYAAEMTIAEHAAVVKAREAAMGLSVAVRTGDPAMRQTSGITGTSVIQEYAEHDLYIGVEGVPRDVQIGIAKMQQYFRVPEMPDGSQGRPKWVITDNCVNLIRELKGLRWKTYSSKKMQYEHNKREEIHKKDDHAADSARYFATLMPDLAPDEVAEPYAVPKSGDGVLYDEALLRSARERQYENDGWKIYTTTDA